MALKATATVQVSAEYTNPQDLGTGKLDFLKKFAQIFADGTGNDQVSKLFSDTRNLIASATENLDLAGTLVDVFGTTITFATIKILMVVSKEANANDIIIGNAAATAWLGPFGAATHTVAIRPGGVAMFCAPNAGWTVGAGTTDFLKVLNGGATAVDYDVVIAGT